MGEYAEMMLDGTCCAMCGEYMGDGGGFPIYCCTACEPDDYRAIMAPVRNDNDPALVKRREKRRRARARKSARQKAAREALSGGVT